MSNWLTKDKKILSIIFASLQSWPLQHYETYSYYLIAKWNSKAEKWFSNIHNIRNHSLHNMLLVYRITIKHAIEKDDTYDRHTCTTLVYRIIITNTSLTTRKMETSKAIKIRPWWERMIIDYYLSTKEQKFTKTGDHIVKRSNIDNEATSPVQWKHNSA